MSVVRLKNHSPYTYRGWIRRVVDESPPQDAAQLSRARYRVGRPIGLAGWIVDLHVALDPGEGLHVDLAEPPAADVAIPHPRIPPDWQNRLGRPVIFDQEIGLAWPRPNVSGFLPIVHDGAAVLVHFRERIAPMLVADLWVHYYDGQGWAPAELVVTCSNGSIPDMGAVIPENLHLTFGKAEVHVPGRALGLPLMERGETMADGQARSWPLLLVWRDELRDHNDWNSVAAWPWIGACGVSRVGYLGALAPPAGWDAKTWILRNHGPQVARMHSWVEGPLGVAATSTQTGSTEDHGWVKGQEALHPDGIGAEVLRYYAALGQSRRPCHHLEADGSPLSLTAHPNLVMWQSRAHWHPQVSPDQLGKLRALSFGESGGWSGPDRQHWLIHTLASSVQVLGSPALQWQLEHAARAFLFGETVNPRLSTSGTDASRSAGFTGMVVCWLDLLLEDRALARMVTDRWRERVLRVYAPGWARSTTVKAWDVSNDPRILAEIGYTHARGWMPYQQALGAYGLEVACARLDIQEGRALALEGARAVVDYGYTQAPDGRWLEWDMLGWEESGEPLAPASYVERAGAHRSGMFRHWAFPLASWVVLRHEPQHARALAIWGQLLAEVEAAASLRDWMPPL
jgi:hypothetical protein